MTMQTSTSGYRPISPIASSRFSSYKRLNVAIGVSRNVDISLVVAGAGPDEDRLWTGAEHLAPGQVWVCQRHATGFGEHQFKRQISEWLVDAGAES